MYIRTITDGIYKVDKVSVNNEGETLYTILEYIDVPESKVSKKAESIEDLCDGIAVDNKDVGIFIAPKEMSLSQLLTLCEPTTTFYGGVWNNEGFTFVAKVDENRNLVLINSRLPLF